VKTPTGWIDVELPPGEVTLRITGFDEDGSVTREVEGRWYTASHLAMFLADFDVEDADALAEDLAQESRHESTDWFSGGCLRGLLAVLATFGVWLVGLGFLVWLLVRAF
jgi:hypothetical protein